jgi:hypothetical protein
MHVHAVHAAGDIIYIVDASIEKSTGYKSPVM